MSQEIFRTEFKEVACQETKQVHWAWVLLSALTKQAYSEADWETTSWEGEVYSSEAVRDWLGEELEEVQWEEAGRVEEEGTGGVHLHTHDQLEEGQEGKDAES